MLDAGVTLVWQEPVTAAIGLVQRGEINNRYLSFRHRPALDGRPARAGQAAARATQRIAYLARREQRQVKTGDAIGRS